MCGRARQAMDWSELKFKWWQGQPRLNMQPRWNAAPGQNLLIVRPHSNTEAAEAVRLHWGFIPSWERNPKGGRRPINAMAEHVAASGLWRDAFQHRRCIFPVSGFYEWQRTATAKHPYSIDRADGEVMALAAIWESWRNPETGEPLETFAVITCPPNPFMAEIHNRMPVVLPPQACEAWMFAGAREAQAMLKSCPSEDLVCYRVSDRLGNVRNDGPELAAPLPLPAAMLSKDLAKDPAKAPLRDNST